MSSRCVKSTTFTLRLERVTYIELRISKDDMSILTRVLSNETDSSRFSNNEKAKFDFSFVLLISIHRLDDHD